MPKLTYPEAFAELHLHMVTDDQHGYSQPNRLGTGGSHTVILSDGTAVLCRLGDKDCSSSIAEVIEALGRPTNGFTYTGNELDGLLGSGEWYEVTDDTLAVGDVVWRNGHTGMIQWYDGEWCQSEFVHGDFWGGLDGYTGDQDGTEAVVRPYRDWDWYTHLRYCGPEREPMKTGWIEKDGRWWYRRADGSYPTGWALIDGSWYLFDGDGWMLTGWQRWEGLWYYLNPKADGGKGKMLTGWLKEGYDWYHLSALGAADTGWRMLDGAWYHFGEDGRMTHDTFVRGDHGWSYLGHDGKMLMDSTLAVDKDGYVVVS